MWSIAALAQQLGEAACLEAGVALGRAVLALVDDDVDQLAVQRGVELGAGRPLHAVRRATARPARRTSRGRADASRASRRRGRTRPTARARRCARRSRRRRARRARRRGVKSFWKSTMTSARAHSQNRSTAPIPPCITRSSWWRTTMHLGRLRDRLLERDRRAPAGVEVLGAQQDLARRACSSALDHGCRRAPDDAAVRRGRRPASSGRAPRARSPATCSLDDLGGRRLRTSSAEEFSTSRPTRPASALAQVRVQPLLDLADELVAARRPAGGRTGCALEAREQHVERAGRGG